jgi:hypothetical protein
MGAERSDDIVTLSAKETTMKRTRTLIVALLFFAAVPASAQLCGPDVSHSSKSLKQKSPLEINPPGDKALVYVILEHGDRYQHKVSVDRRWIGINKGLGDSYFVFTIEPGTHDLCAMAAVAGHLKVNLEAGKTYYFQQVFITANLVKDQYQLSEISEQDARTILPRCHRTVFWEKGAP